jgi:hypothetical protein
LILIQHVPSFVVVSRMPDSVEVTGPESILQQVWVQPFRQHERFQQFYLDRQDGRVVLVAVYNDESSWLVGYFDEDPSGVLPWPWRPQLDVNLEGLDGPH